MLRACPICSACAAAAARTFGWPAPMLFDQACEVQSMYSGMDLRKFY